MNIIPNTIGFNNGNIIHCQELEAPEIDFKKFDSPADENIQDKTHPVPNGVYSPFCELQFRNVNPAEAIMLSVLNYKSNFEKGITHPLSIRQLSDDTGMSKRRVKKTVKSLIAKDWITREKRGTNQKGSVYKLKHHNCKRENVPLNKYGNPEAIQMPYGKNSPHQTMFEGRITWKALLIWIVLKAARSNWKNGITSPTTIKMLCALTGFGTKTVCNALKELREAKLLKRLSKSYQAGVYQLYPKPKPKPKTEFNNSYKNKFKKCESYKDLEADGDCRLSYNKLWRVNLETLEYQTRKSRNSTKWRLVTLGDNMPEAIRRDFELCLETYHNSTNQQKQTTNRRKLDPPKQPYTQTTKQTMKQVMEQVKGQTTEQTPRRTPRQAPRQTTEQTFDKEKLLQNINDPELREAFAELMDKSQPQRE